MGFRGTAATSPKASGFRCARSCWRSEMTTGSRTTAANGPTRSTVAALRLRQTFVLEDASGDEVARIQERKLSIREGRDPAPRRHGRDCPQGAGRDPRSLRHRCRARRRHEGARQHRRPRVRDRARWRHGRDDLQEMVSCPGVLRRRRRSRRGRPADPRDHRRHRLADHTRRPDARPEPRLTRWEPRRETRRQRPSRCSPPPFHAKEPSLLECCFTREFRHSPARRYRRPAPRCRFSPWKEHSAQRLGATVALRDERRSRNNAMRAVVALLGRG